MDKVAFFQKKLDAFFAKKSAEKRRSLKLIIAFNPKKTGILQYELWASNNEFIEYQQLKNILDLSFAEKTGMLLSNITEESIEQGLVTWFTKKAMEFDVDQKEIGGLLKQNGEYSILISRKHFKQFLINEII